VSVHKSSAEPKIEQKPSATESSEPVSDVANREDVDKLTNEVKSLKDELTTKQDELKAAKETVVSQDEEISKLKEEAEKQKELILEAEFKAELTKAETNFENDQ